MLRMSIKHQEYLLINGNIKIVFLGGTAEQVRLMIDAPTDVNVVRSRALEKRMSDEERKQQPNYYKVVEHPEKYKKRQHRHRTEK